MQTARVDSRKMASEARSLESLSGGGIQIRGRSERLESAESSGPEVFQGRPTSPDGDSLNREPENRARHRQTAFDTAKKAVETKKKPAIVLCTIAGQFVYPTVNRSSSRNLELRGQDSNLRPRGYEPRELPGCSTPRCFIVDTAVSLRFASRGQFLPNNGHWSLPPVPPFESSFSG